MRGLSHYFPLSHHGIIMMGATVYLTSRLGSRMGKNRDLAERSKSTVSCRNRCFCIFRFMVYFHVVVEVSQLTAGKKDPVFAEKKELIIKIKIDLKLFNETSKKVLELTEILIFGSAIGSTVLWAFHIGSTVILVSCNFKIALIDIKGMI